MPLSAILAFTIGAALGSFLNVVILRYKGRLGGVITGRSKCPACHKTLTWPELVPLLSFIFQRGRCRACRNQLSLQYPLVELITGISVLILFTPLPTSAIAITSAILSTVSITLLIVLFVIDLRTLILPDTFIIILATVVALTLLFNYQPLNILYGAGLGSGALAFLWLITRGRGLGLGDVKLMLPLGALFGPTNTLILLFLAFITGGIIGTSLLITGRANMKTPIPFGPFLTAVAILFILIPELPQAILNAIIG